MPSIPAVSGRTPAGRSTRRSAQGLGAVLAGVTAVVTLAAPATAAAPPTTTAPGAATEAAHGGNGRRNTPPATPTNLTTYPATACGTSASPTRLPESMVTPTFTATLADADGDNLTGYLEIRRASDDSLVHGPIASATVPSGPVTWPTLPGGVLAADGTGYYYQAWAVDSRGAVSPTTGRCHFLVDGVDPGEPSVTVGAMVTGTIGLVTFSPAAGDDDIAGYRYGFDSYLGLWVPADATGTATVPVTLWGDPFFPGGTATANLWVKAVDRVGNQRAGTTGPVLIVADDFGATVADRRGDVNGDGLADVAAVLDLGNNRTTAWAFLSSGTGFHPPTMSWDTGVSSGTEVDRFATASGDFDNDGRADIALFRQDPDGQVRLFNLRSDTNQYRSDWSERVAGTWQLADARVFAGDFTGDGIDDAAAVVSDSNGGWTMRVYPSTGTSFGAGVTWFTQASGTYTWAATRTLAGDFTGDGRTDLAFAQDTTGGHTTVRVHASTGGALSAGTVWWDSATDSDPAGFTGSAAKWAVADLDGTTADDLVVLYDEGAGSTLRVLTASVDAFSAPMTRWDSADGADSANGWDWAATGQLTTGDFDNDGDDDLAALVTCCGTGVRQLWVFPNTGTDFGLVTQRGSVDLTAVP